MNFFRGTICLLTLALLLGSPTGNAFGAPADQDPLGDSPAVQPNLPPSLTTPGGDGDGDTDPDPEEEHIPIGYSLDGNDYFDLQFAGDLVLSINGLEMEAISQNATLRFVVTVLGEDAEASASHYSGVKTPVAGTYQIFFSNFDPTQFQLQLKVQTPQGTTTYDLEPGSQVSFRGQTMDLVLYGGEEQPAPGIAPEERIPMTNGSVTYVVEQTGDLVIAARQHPNFLEPDPLEPEQPSEDSPEGGTPLDLPEDSLDNVEAADDAENLPAGEGVGAQVGGSGCITSQLIPGSPQGDALLWIFVGMFLSWGRWLLRRA
ncbi:MAG: hypothetical protein R3257_00130 [bacterium]|nr:hypothetical protein [bacterium]